MAYKYFTSLLADWNDIETCSQSYKTANLIYLLNTYTVQVALSVNIEDNKVMAQNALIVGGSSGLGLGLASLLSSEYSVTVTGRRDPKEEGIAFYELELGDGSLSKTLDAFVDTLPEIDLLVYAAGFFQEGTISDLSDSDIEKMDRVGLLAPAMLLQRILKKQDKLPGFIAITSTSQWTPRKLEPVYTAVKAGLGMMANSLSQDERVGKVMIAGPAGMNTRFWEHAPRDMSVMLDPKWVAEAILKEWGKPFSYKFARFLRGPARVEVVETR
jgi:NAD(P)-dependent dehydrogenase (short-subunit alcohol dehydrogenase family)